MASWLELKYINQRGFTLIIAWCNAWPAVKVLNFPCWLTATWRCNNGEIHTHIPTTTHTQPHTHNHTHCLIHRWIIQDDSRRNHYPGQTSKLIHWTSLYPHLDVFHLSPNTTGDHSLTKRPGKEMTVSAPLFHWEHLSQAEASAQRFDQVGFLHHWQ